MKRLGFLLALGFLALPSYGAEAPLDAKLTTISFLGHATMHDFHGKAQDVSGSAEIDRASPNLVTGAVLDIGAARLTTFQDSRDRNMRDWLQVETNSDIQFRLTKIRRVSGDPLHATRALPAVFMVTGDFLLNHHTRSLTGRVIGWRDGPRLVIDGTTSLDTTQFGLPIIRELFLTVDQNVDVTFHLVFDLPGAG